MSTIVTYAKKTKIAEKFRTYRQLKYFERTDSSILNPAQKAFIKQVEAAVSSLPELEKEVITRRFLQDNSEYVTNEQVYKELMISAPVYSRIQSRALKKLEIVLDVNK